jgi:hypothetical protein
MNLQEAREKLMNFLAGKVYMNFAEFNAITEEFPVLLVEMATVFTASLQVPGIYEALKEHGLTDTDIETAKSLATSKALPDEYSEEEEDWSLFL